MMAEYLLPTRGFAVELAYAGRRFRIASNDYRGAVLLPGLLAKVRQAAPKVVLDRPELYVDPYADRVFVSGSMTPVFGGLDCCP